MMDMCRGPNFTYELIPHFVASEKRFVESSSERHNNEDHC